MSKKSSNSNYLIKMIKIILVMLVIILILNVLSNPNIIKEFTVEVKSLIDGFVNLIIVAVVIGLAIFLVLQYIRNNKDRE